MPNTTVHAEPVIGLLERCVVPILSGRKVVGTGFFIAPGRLLTCSHVLYDAELAVEVMPRDEARSAPDAAGRPAAGSEDLPSLRLRFGGADYPIDVDSDVIARDPKYAEVDSKFWPLPDVALLRVDVPGHGCVLADWPSAVPGEHRYLVFGFPGGVPTGEPRAQRIPLSFEEPDYLDDHDWPVSARDSKRWIVQGMSGGPVLDVVTGAVVAIVKAANFKAGVPDGTGRVVSLAHGLRQLALDDPSAEVWSLHDEYHSRENAVWPQRADDLRARESEASSASQGVAMPMIGAVDLMGLFADFAAAKPAREGAVSLLCLVSGLPEDHIAKDVGSARDAVMWLLRQNSGVIAAQSIVEFLSWLPAGSTPGRVPDSARARRIDELVHRFALPVPAHKIPQEPARSHPGVHVLIEPDDSAPDSYRLAVWSVWRDGVMRSEGGLADPVARDGIERALKPLLRDLLTKVRPAVPDGHPLLVDFVVPDDLRDLEPGAWMFPRGDPLDSQDVVVLRDWYRFRHQMPERKKQRAWWDRLAAMTSLPVSTIPCGELWTGECPPFSLESAVVVPAPVWRGKPEGPLDAAQGAAAVTEMLKAGGSVAVWKAQDCDEHSAAPEWVAPNGSLCSGDGFGSGITGLLDGVTLADFPVQFWRACRERARAEAKPGRAGVMWDDPDRRPGPARLSVRGGRR